VIVVKIPRRNGGRSLENFVTPILKKFKRNAHNKRIQLRGEVAYSKNYMYFILSDYALELAFALSLYLKCQKHGIPCVLEISSPINPEEIPRDVNEVARVWAERKLPRKYYSLRNVRVNL